MAVVPGGENRVWVVQRLLYAQKVKALLVEAQSWRWKEEEDEEEEEEKHCVFFRLLLLLLPGKGRGRMPVKAEGG